LPGEIEALGLIHRRPIVRALTAVSDHLCFRPYTEVKPMEQGTITVRHNPADGWEVEIVEDGEKTERHFDNGEYAHSYAEGQGVRLGVPVTRVREEDDAETVAL